MNIDITKDKDWLETIFQEEKFDIVNHHAAQKSVASSMQNPTFDAHSNIMASLYLLENAARYGVKKFIFISSGGALSNDQSQIPSPENIQPKLESPYAISKYTIEKYLEFYHTNFGLTYTILRYANVYGPRQTPDGESGVVPIFLRNLLAGKPSVIYTFPDMPRGATRDYVYITDVVEANMLALSKGDNQTFNIGTGIETATEDLYEYLQNIYDIRIPAIKKLATNQVTKRSALNCKQARDILGWQYKIDVYKGLDTMIQSIRAKGV